MNLCFGIEILSRLDQFTVQKCQNWALLKWFYSLFWPSVKLCGRGLWNYSMFWEMHFWVPGKLLSFRKVSCTYKSTSKQAQSKSITVSVSSILELIIIHCIWNALLFTEIYILSSTFSSQIFQGFHKIHQHLKQTWIANADIFIPEI